MDRTILRKYLDGLTLSVYQHESVDEEEEEDQVVGARDKARIRHIFGFS
jgi:hypothetical protein